MNSQEPQAKSRTGLYVGLFLIPLLAIPWMWIKRDDIDNDTKKKLSVIAGIWFLVLFFMPGKETKKSAPAVTPVATQTVQTETKVNEIVNLNENTSINLPQGTEVIIEGIVEAGNGKKANRFVDTGFGTVNAQPIAFETKNITIWVLLVEPSDRSLYEQNLKIKGKIDYKVTDPIVPKPDERNIVITDAAIIK